MTTELNRLTELEKNLAITRKALEDARTRKAAADARAEMARKELDRLGVTPETAAEAMEQCTAEIDKALSEAEALIPVELLKKLQRM